MDSYLVPDEAEIIYIPDVNIMKLIRHEKKNYILSIYIQRSYVHFSHSHGIHLIATHNFQTLNIWNYYIIRFFPAFFIFCVWQQYTCTSSY